MNNKRIFLSAPHMGGNEIKYIQEAFDENWIAPLGPNVNNFETELASYNNIDHAAALSAGTAAIHLALIILGIEQDDEVICSSFTFSATVNPIIYQKAIPVLVDSEPDTWNMCPKALEEAIKDRITKGKTPKAIIPVHLYGMPSKMEEIKEVASRYNIPVIEDAAESLGATINGKKTGTFGLMGIYSFNGNKIITTSGGGSLVSNNEEYINKSRFLATQARDAAPYYQHSEIGYNYRMSNISAGIGRGQLEVLDERIVQRRAVYKRYEEAFKHIDGFTFIDEPEGFFSNRWLSTILIDSKKFNGVGTNEIREMLETHNIESRPLWKPMHLQPIFEKYPYYGTRLSEKLFEKGLCLPSCSSMTIEEQENIITLMKKKLGV